MLSLLSWFGPFLYILGLTMVGIACMRNLIEEQVG